MKDSYIIATPDHGVLEFELAGVASRFLAHAVDVLLLVASVLGLLLLIWLTQWLGLGRWWTEGWFQRAMSEWLGSWMMALLIIGVYGVIWGYFVFFETVWRGRTPGKKYVGVRVIGEDGIPIGFREAAIRNLVRAADMLPPPFYLLGAMTVFWDVKRRRLGDLVAGTVVVFERFDLRQESGLDAAWALRAEKGQARRMVVLSAGNLSARQVEGMERYMARRVELPLEKRRELSWRMVKPFLGMIQEKVEDWERDGRRLERCEQLLEDWVERARSGGMKEGVKGAEPNRGKKASLF